jgi:MFS family permease
MPSNTTASPYPRIARRLMPLLFVCYVFNYLDRSNVGYAQLQMKAWLGFSDAVFGLGAGIFFLGYALFELPSNLLLARAGIRRTLLRIMVLWGLASTAMMFVASPAQFYLLRFLVGVFEAGFAPGVLFYLSLWFPARQRAQMTALFFMAFAAAPIVAGPVAGVVLSQFHGWHGLAGWQWLFLIEGLPTVLLGVLAFFWLPDGPAQATWLTATQREQVQADLAAEGAHAPPLGLGSVLRDGRVWLLGLIGLLVVMGIYALTFWQPTLLASTGLSLMQVGLAAVLPAVASIVAMVVVGRRSDRLQERRGHFAVMALLGAAGLCALPWNLHAPGPALACLALAAVGLSGAFVVLWAIPAGFMAERTAAAGIALVSTISACGGLLAPLLVGGLKTATGGFVASFSLLGAALVLAALLMRFALPASALPATPPGAKVGARIQNV